MAKISLTPANVYSIVDAVKLSSENTGQLLGQDLELDATNFATEVLENGQCVVVKGKTIKNPATATDKVVLNVTACEIYDDISGKETFAVKRGRGSNPRLFALNQTDEFQTNAVFYDNTEYADLATLKQAIKNGTVVAVPDASRDWKLTDEANLTGAEKVYGEVLEFVALSNDRDGVLIRIA